VALVYLVSLAELITDYRLPITGQSGCRSPFFVDMKGGEGKEKAR
jgi:hypothetical protein